MIRPNFDPTPDKPTPEMLVGVNVYIEGEEDLTVRPCKQPEPFGSPQEFAAPSVDQLAGVFVLVEAPEDLTVRPSRAPGKSNRAPIQRPQ